MPNVNVQGMDVDVRNVTVTDDVVTIVGKINQMLEESGAEEVQAFEIHDDRTGQTVLASGPDSPALRDQRTGEPKVYDEDHHTITMRQSGKAGSKSTPEELEQITDEEVTEVANTDELQKESDGGAPVEETESVVTEASEAA